MAAPTAEFSALPLTGAESLSVQFTDESTDSPTERDWDFGDGSAHSTEQNPLHIYTEEGEYTVTLIATNVDGSDTETKTEYITVTPVPEVPVAAFSSDVQIGECPVPVAFTDASLNQPTTRWRDFGDGHYSNLQNPTHTYYLPGTYTVSLKVTNKSGVDTEEKVDYLTFEETDDGLENIENVSEARRGGRTFPRLAETLVEEDDRTIIEARGENIPLTGNEMIEE